MSHSCPICNNRSQKVMSFKKVNIYECNDCFHMFSKEIQLSPEEIYSSDYFLKEHKNFFDHPDKELYTKVSEYIKMEKEKNVAIVDLGCGTGNFLNFLNNEGFTDLTGVDLIKNEDPNINYIQSDILKYSPEKKFDIVVSNMNIEHIEDLDSYISKIDSILADDGLLILNTINENSLIYAVSKFLYRINIKFVAERLYEPHHVNHFSVDSLSLLLKRFNFTTRNKIVKNYPLNSIDLTPGLWGSIQKLFVGIIFSVSPNKAISQTQFFKRL